MHSRLMTHAPMTHAPMTHALTTHALTTHALMTHALTTHALMSHGGMCASATVCACVHQPQRVCMCASATACVHVCISHSVCACVHRPQRVCMCVPATAWGHVCISHSVGAWSPLQPPPQPRRWHGHHPSPGGGGLAVLVHHTLRYRVYMDVANTVPGFCRLWPHCSRPASVPLHCCRRKTAGVVGKG